VNPTPGTRTAAAASDTLPDAGLIPGLLLRRGRICLPGPDGPVPARRSSGGEFDIFDVIDALSPKYPALYLVDLDGLERNDPQLEYVQELSRDMPLWVDSGVRQAEQAIDVIVAGAQKAVLSSAFLASPRELRRAWRLSTELLFEIETVDGRTDPIDPSWGSTDPLAVAQTAREVGLSTVIVSARGEDPDWSLVAQLAAHGPTWVDGAFAPGDLSRAAEARAEGGIFHLNEVLTRLDQNP
jgi:hypothetical protein